MWLFLAVAKAARCAALFAAVDVLARTNAPIAAFLCFVLAAAACCLALLQPAVWRRVSLTGEQRVRIVAHAAAFVSTLWLWCYGLKHCGPVMTVLLEASEVGIVTLLALGLSRASRDGAQFERRRTSRLPQPCLLHDP